MVVGVCVYVDVLKARKIAVWGVAAVGAVVPAVMFVVSLRAAERSHPLDGGWSRAAAVLLGPGVFPGMMARSWVVQVVVSGVFWGVLAGALAAAALVKWRDRGAALRAVTFAGALAAVYGVLTAWMAAGWNPD